MMIFIPVFAAIATYMITSVNLSVILSLKIYLKDIRSCGSGNPGFTNFKRNFGSKYAWVILVFDLLKAAVPVLSFSCVFEFMYGCGQLGAAYTGLFALLGHNFPLWHGFKGGKGFLVYMSVIWFVDWRAGLVAVIVLCLLLMLTKYMSLSTMCAVLSTPATLIFTSTESLWVIIICAVQALFIVARHKENIKRLYKHTESKFHFR